MGSIIKSDFFLLRFEDETMYTSTTDINTSQEHLLAKVAPDLQLHTVIWEKSGVGNGMTKR